MPTKISSYKSKLIPFLIAGSLTDCAATGSTTRTMIYPVIDASMNPQGRNYYQDIEQCNAYARQVSAAGSGATHAIAGGAVGAALGAAIGAALGINPGTTAALGVGAGGISAGAQRAVSATHSKHAIVAKCMSGRGYAVLSQ